MLSSIINSGILKLDIRKVLVRGPYARSLWVCSHKNSLTLVSVYRKSKSGKAFKHWQRVGLNVCMSVKIVPWHCDGMWLLCIVILCALELDVQSVGFSVCF